MLISDPLYGEFEINGLLEDLIVSKPVQRLKGIHQAGAGFLVNSRWTISRFEHSVGVMLLIRQFGGSLQEQVAGLLHDVSHTAFSHVVDVVLKMRRKIIMKQYSWMLSNSLRYLRFLKNMATR